MTKRERRYHGRTKQRKYQRAVQEYIKWVSVALAVEKTKALLKEPPTPRYPEGRCPIKGVAIDGEQIAKEPLYNDRVHWKAKVGEQTYFE